MDKKRVDASSAKDLEQIFEKLGLLFTEIHNAYLKHRISLKYKNVEAGYSKQIRQSLADLYQAPAVAEGGETFAVQETVTHLSKVLYDIIRLSDQVENKIKSNIIFSEEALGEMNSLIIRTQALLPHIRDALRTGNPIIVSHIEKETSDLGSLAADNIGYHEDRLCRGKCHPKASTVYLLMIQNLQDVLWHFKALVSHEIIK